MCWSTFQEEEEEEEDEDDIEAQLAEEFEEEEEEDEEEDETEEDATDRMRNDLEEIYDKDTNSLAAVQVCTFVRSCVSMWRAGECKTIEFEH